MGQGEQAGVETTAAPGCDGLGWSLSHITSLEWGSPGTEWLLIPQQSLMQKACSNSNAVQEILEENWFWPKF